MSNDMKDNACFSGKFKRLNYYEGMLLTEQDFKAEQKYFREKMKLHNRLHGYGVVWGLEVTKRCVKESATSAEKFFIEPGFALDCTGNEIVVCHPYRLPVDEKIEELLQACKPVKEKICLLISIKYCERESEPQAQYASVCAEDELQVKMSRICEGFSVELLPGEKMDDCCKQHSDYHGGKTYRQDCLGAKDCCENECGIILGCICIVPEKKGECDDQYYATGSTESTQPRRDTDKLSIAYSSLQVFIDPCCKPPRVCRPCVTPQQQWEHHKQQLLQAVCRESGSFDLTCLIGKTMLEAEKCLNEHIKVSVTRHSITEFQHGLLSQLHNAASCVYPGSNVILIIDNKTEDGYTAEGCVLFAFSIPDSYRGGDDER